jgi:hypothetical protein
MEIMPCVKSLPRMNVFILGADHELQRVDAWRSDDMKREYRDLLTRIVDVHGVQFICEEASPIYTYVGEEITASRGLTRPWRNIDMPQAIREQRRIAEEQNHRLVEPRLGTIKSHVGDDGYYEGRRNGRYRVYQRVPSDAVREEYMYERAIEGAGNANSILVICGHMHAPELEKRFKNAGHTVTIDMLHNYGWYSNQ